MKKINQLFLLTFVLFGIFLTKVNASDVVARIGENGYESLDDAILAVKEDEVIELLQDTQLTKVAVIDKKVTINGNNHNVNIYTLPSDDGRLTVSGILTFNQTKVNHDNITTGSNAWSIVVLASGAINLNQSEYYLKSHGVYAYPGASINLDHSVLSATDMAYTAFMGDKRHEYADINLSNQSLLKIDRITSENGTNWFSIKADNSNISVTNCAKQGLVGGRLELSNESEAIYDNNGIGFTLYRNDYVVVHEGAKLSITNSHENAIWQWGGKVEVNKDGNFIATGNGTAIDDGNDDSSNATINNYNSSENGIIIFEDGANVKINSNYLRGITNNGVAYIGNTTEIMDNGLITKEGNRIPQYGGGVFNQGTITIAENARLYNNHATLAADDIYSTGIIRFKEVGNDWILDDCNHKINGWYDDAVDSRWNAHDLGHIYVNLVTPDIYEGELSLKAAHDKIGKVIINYVDIDGNQLTDEITLTGEVGKNYLTEKKNFDGYIFVKVEGNQEGLFNFENTYVTYYYTKYTGSGDVEVVPPKTGVGEEVTSVQVCSLNLYKKEDE